jgi:hypothetical protein
MIPVMTYRQRELARLTELAIETWPAQTTRRPPYVLAPELARDNLLADVRRPALSYFDLHNIRWWLSTAEEAERAVLAALPAAPTGHLNSSQVACINHLEPARLDKEVALTVARRLDPRVREVRDTGEAGFVAFEWIGDKSYLNERGARTRGAKLSSIDAIMRVTLRDDTPMLILIEWKYTEAYEKGREMRYRDGTDRVERYRTLMESEDSPLQPGSPERLFYEPYEQLMRQTLLAAAVVADADAPELTWMHVHVIPAENVELRKRVKQAVPLLGGDTLEETWKGALKAPEQYRVVTPTDVVPETSSTPWARWRCQLSERYLT